MRSEIISAAAVPSEPVLVLSRRCGKMLTNSASLQTTPGAAAVGADAGGAAPLSAAEEIGAFCCSARARASAQPRSGIAAPLMLFHR